MKKYSLKNRIIASSMGCRAVEMLLKSDDTESKAIVSKCGIVIAVNETFWDYSHLYKIFILYRSR